MGRIPCCEKDAVKRGQWTPEEDAKLVSYISQNGTRNWRLIPKKAGLQRCGKSCRLRWTNYLRPDLKHGEFTADEEQSIVKLHSVVGNRWSLIAAQLPGRTDNDVKNHWNTKLKKKLSGMGIDPVTHKPFSHLMAEIASTLAPPQVAHLAEAALGCFKDEMLHLLTKKRIDWQLEKTTVSNGSQHPNRMWDHLPSNSYCHENRLAKDKRTVDAEFSKLHESNIFSNEPAISPSKLPWDSAQINGEVKNLSNCSGLNGLCSSFLQHPGPTHRYSFAGGATTGKYEVGPSTWSIEYPGHAENLDRTSFLTSAPPLKSSTEKRQQGVESGGSSMALWKLPVECNDDEEGSPWSQSVCSGSTCTGGDRHGFPPPQIKEEDDEEEGEEAEAASDGGRGSVKGVEAFNSDCVLWDLSDDLMNPII